MRLLPIALLEAIFVAPIAADDKAPAPDVDHPLPVCGKTVVKQVPCATVPKPIKMRDPEYPDQARRDKVEGTVELTIVIDDHGDVARAAIVKGLRKDLDDSAIEAVRKWKFEPGTYGGKPVPVTVPVRMNFRLR